MKNLRMQRKMIVAFSAVEYIALAFFIYAIYALHAMNSSFQALQLDDPRLAQAAAAAQTRTVWATVVIVVGVVIVFAVAVGFTFKLSRGLRFPADELVRAARSVARGEVDIQVTHQSGDELGELADAFREMSAYLQDHAGAIDRLAAGDYSRQVSLKSERDDLSRSLNILVDKNSRMLGDIKETSEQVTLASQQIAMGAQSLATSSSEQSAMVERFTALMEDILAGAEKNAGNAVDAAGKAGEVGGLMGKSIDSMETLRGSMRQIADSSGSITKVVKVIDDIAFQTNILALNAAVEAARAGQHGKGFAVVADEVRNLASKSAEAARETATLIEGNTGQIHQGYELAEQTRGYLQDVAELARLSNEQMDAIAVLSQQQMDAIQEMNTAIGEIVSSVQSNAATAEESAAASEEMYSHAELMQKMVESFHLADVSAQPQPLPTEADISHGQATASQGFALAQDDKYA